MSVVTSDYEAFLREKFDFHADYGFDVDPAELSPVLLPHQRDIVARAIKGGRRESLAPFGLGTGSRQRELMRVLLAHHIGGEGSGGRRGGGRQRGTKGHALGGVLTFGWDPSLRGGHGRSAGWTVGAGGAMDLATAIATEPAAAQANIGPVVGETASI